MKKRSSVRAVIKSKHRSKNNALSSLTKKFMLKCYCQKECFIEETK
jgi:hypothetical protein